MDPLPLLDPAGLPAMSSGESELRAMARAISERLHAQQVLQEMGGKVRVVIMSDATAALSNAARLGPGRIRHLGVSVGFVKDAVRTCRVILRNVASAENDADLHTKHMKREVFEAICTRIGMAEVHNLDKYKEVKLEKLNHFKDLMSDGAEGRLSKAQPCRERRCGDKILSPRDTC